jgi:hypothetical protein
MNPVLLSYDGYATVCALQILKKLKITFVNRINSSKSAFGVMPCRGSIHRRRDHDYEHQHIIPSS